MSLLSPQSELVAISIEGSSPSESECLSTAREGEQVIDVAEYFGNEILCHAKRVRYVQLKHSTRRSSVSFTASGLNKTFKGFADRFQELSNHCSIRDLVERFEFWFVTNRPVNRKIKEAMIDAANKLEPRYPAELEKLKSITDLNQSEFSTFSGLVHFEDCQDDYWQQRNILSRELSGYLPGFDIEAPTQLKELVTRKALSESAENPVITKMDVLRVLHTDEERLFPARNLIKPIKNSIPRKQEVDIVHQVLQIENRPVIIHASAGVGKSIFSMRIPTLLPPGSACVVYDCFGNGTYRNASSYRHRHKDALVQIANELGVKGLCHPLVPTNHADASDYIRAFLYRLRQSIEKLRATDLNAVLCIVIDAADNAQMAAKASGSSRSFALDLLRETLPDGVRLVVLSRSHRIDYLEPPTHALELELNPFSQNETGIHIRQHFSDASDQDVNEFHYLSSQNPRVQAYALSRNQSISIILQQLGPNPTSVEAAFESLLSTAIANLKDTDDSIERKNIDKICTGLAVLPPRIPVPVLSQISRVSEEAVHSFTLELGEFLIISDKKVQFRDETVETWFREKFIPSPNKLEKFVNRLKLLANQCAYAASTLPKLMLEVDQFQELVDLALSSSALPETSELEKEYIELQRIQFALKASLRMKRYLDAAKLSLKAGSVAASSVRQYELVQNNTDLAAEFIATNVVEDIISRRIFKSNWLGSSHVYEACLLSCTGISTNEARSRLRMAEEWIRNWCRVSHEKQNRKKISATDIAELAMAHLNVHGADHAANFIGAWQPPKISLKVGRILARKLIDHGRFTELDDLAISAENNYWLVLAITAELRNVHRTPPSKVIFQAFSSIANPCVRSEYFKKWDGKLKGLAEIPALVEAAQILALFSRADLAKVLEQFLPKTPPQRFSTHFDSLNSELLRAYCLHAALTGEVLKLTDLAHPKLRKLLENEMSSHHSSEATDFAMDIGILLSWYQLWAAVLLGKISKNKLHDQLSCLLKLSNKITNSQLRPGVRTTDEIVLIWFEVLCRLNAFEPNLIDSLKSWIQSLRRPLFIPTFLALTRLASQSDETKALALYFAVKAFELIQSERTSAYQKSITYVEIARSVLTISESEAKSYFDEAITVSSKIDEENLFRWNAMLYLADRATQRGQFDPKVAYQFSRCAELTWDYEETGKYFDWETTVRALTLLCPISSLAIISRWRDRGFGNVKKMLPIVVDTLVKRGNVESHDSLAFLGFDANWNYPKLLADFLDKCEYGAAKEVACAYILRYKKLADPTSVYWKEIKEIVVEHGFCFPELDSYITHSEQPEVKQSDVAKENSHGNEQPCDMLDDPFSNIDLTTADGISQSFNAYINISSGWVFDQYFIEAIDRISPGSESAFFDAFGNIPEFTLIHLSTILQHVPEDWCERLAVRQALGAMVKVFCRRFYMNVSRHRYYELFPFGLVCTLTDLTEEDIVDVVLAAVSDSSSQFDSERLFNLVGLLKSKLTGDEAFEALKFGLGFYESVLEEEDGDGTWSDRLSPPNSIQESIAGYIYAGLAAPSATIRWEAAHAVLGLCELGRYEVLKYLALVCEKRDAGPFVDTRLPFYRLHALQWLMMAFARAATEFSTALEPIAYRFVDLALKDQHHVMIRQFAARAALALIEKGVLDADDELVESLSTVNLTSFPLLESNLYEQDCRNNYCTNSANGEDQFLFDYDIGSYWYKPLGRVFGLTQSEIENRAHEIIKHKLNFSISGQVLKDERKRIGLYDYRQTYASHGSYPNTDSLRHYLSYHAMMIVAGMLLEANPIVDSTESAEQDRFTEWLSQHDLTRTDGRWLADGRDSPPLDQLSWLEQAESELEDEMIPATAFDQVLLTGNNVIVWGSWSIVNLNRVQDVHVRSALVSPDKSLALLRALSTTKDIHYYLIPSSDDNLQIEKIGFILKGWIEDCGTKSNLESKDYWSGGVYFPPPAPAAEIVKLMDLESDLDKRTWLNMAKVPVMISRIWGQCETSDQEERPEHGECLQASLEFVRDTLNKIKFDMIVDVQIEIRKRHSSYQIQQNSEKEIPRKSKLYLFRADGRITTI